jgi:hypothetical protein
LFEGVISMTLFKYSQNLVLPPSLFAHSVASDYLRALEWRPAMGNWR